MAILRTPDGRFATGTAPGPGRPKRAADTDAPHRAAELLAELAAPPTPAEAAAVELALCHLKRRGVSIDVDSVLAELLTRRLAVAVQAGRLLEAERRTATTATCSALPIFLQRTFLRDCRRVPWRRFCACQRARPVSEGNTPVPKRSPPRQ